MKAIKKSKKVSRKKLKRLKLSQQNKLILLIAAVILLILFLLITRHISDKQTATTISPTDIPIISPSAQPVVNNKGEYEIISYNTDNKKIKILSKIPDRTSRWFGEVAPLRDGDNLYIADSKTLTRFSLTTNQKQTIYTTTSDKDIITISKSETGHIYLGLGPENLYDPGNKDDSFSLIELDPSSGKTLREISPIRNLPAYAGVTYLFKSGDSDIIGSFGGDGCGGYGTIYRVRNGSQEKVLETGSGCDLNPRYIGVLPNKNQVLLANIISGSNKLENDTFSQKYDVLYGQNVSTGEKDPIYDLKQIQDLQYMTLNEDNSVTLFAKSDNYKLNLTDRSITKTQIDQPDVPPARQIQQETGSSEPLPLGKSNGEDIYLIEVSAK